MTHLLDTLQLGWFVFSGKAFLLAIGGVALAAVGLLLTAWLPAFLRHALVAVGIVVVLLATTFQLGRREGVHDMELRAAADAATAETTRSELAEQTRDAIAAQAVQNQAELQAQNHTLTEIKDGLEKDLAAANRECVARGLSRRLRNL